MLGFLTFTGSLLAAGKLQEVKWIPAAPGHLPGAELHQPRPACHRRRHSGVALMHQSDGALGDVRCSRRSSCWRSLFGVLLIIPIGGADMPTVISILNAYAGLSAVAMGFVLDNKLLITAGALDGPAA